MPGATPLIAAADAAVDAVRAAAARRGFAEVDEPDDARRRDVAVTRGALRAFTGEEALRWGISQSVADWPLEVVHCIGHRAFGILH
jgi:hypothetical protein